jgi:predicted RNase H-like HicB family nuclease
MISAEERVRILNEAKPSSWLAFSSDESEVVGRGDTYSEAVEDGEADPS